jgi:ATP-dependent DNA helicase PIF1
MLKGDLMTNQDMAVHAASQIRTMRVEMDRLLAGVRAVYAMLDDLERDLNRPDPLAAIPAAKKSSIPATALSTTAKIPARGSIAPELALPAPAKIEAAPAVLPAPVVESSLDLVKAAAQVAIEKIEAGEADAKLEVSPAAAPEPAPVADVTTEDGLVLNAEWQQVLKALNGGADNVFVTGGAGTGKSTMLEHFIHSFKGAVAVVAPTGVAALRVHGETIHKFFRFGAHAIQAEDIHLVDLRWRGKYERLNVLVIDEISMVRADLMDGIDMFLRKNGPDRSRPFGGVRVVMFGDPFQLPPVSKDDKEKAWLKRQYGSDCPFFFHANVWRNGAPLTTFQLTTIFRQKAGPLTDALNAIRSGDVLPEHLALLNSRVDPVPPKPGDMMTLTTTNMAAEQANQHMMSLIDAEPFTFDATVSGDFNLKDAPTDQHLTLKVGALVMFIRNDSDRDERKYVNGTMGKVASIEVKEDEDGVKTRILTVKVGERDIVVNPETWEQIAYEWDEEKGKLVKVIRGMFTQIPLKLGAAITIHKCIAGDTLVSTGNRGLIPIRDVRVGDTVVTAGPTRPVLAAVGMGNKRVLTIRTAGRREIKCTPEHKICVQSGNERLWIEAQDLTVGDLLLTQSHSDLSDFDTPLPAPEGNGPRSKPIQTPDQMDTLFAWWLGVLIGDGSYTDQKEGNVWLTTSSLEVLDYFKWITTQFFGINISQREKTKSNCYEGYFTSLPLRKWLQRIGLDAVIAPEKNIPSVVFSSEYSIRASFLRGLFDTDGAVNSKGMIIFTTTSKKLIEGVHVLLDSLGIESRQMAPQPAYYTSGGKKTITGTTSYQLRISSHSEPHFMDVVGFTRSDRESAWKAKGWTEEKANKSSLIPFTDAITEIVNDGTTADVYDLEVDTDHNFYANGLLVSNSQGLTLDQVCIDMAGGAFAAGQTYVALSRCRTLEGMKLRHEIKPRDIMVDSEVRKFLSGQPIAAPANRLF